MVFNDAIDNKDRFFKGQQRHETFVCFFRHHWIDLLKDFITFAVLVVFIYFTVKHVGKIQDFLRGNREMKLFFFTGYLIGTIYMHRFFIKMLNFFVNIGIITDMRIIDHHNKIYFCDTLDSIDLSQIQNIEKVEEGILPNILKYGDIKIFMTGSSSTKTFYRVPNSKFHFRCLNREREIRHSALQRKHIGIGPAETQSQHQEQMQVFQTIEPPQ